MPTALLLLDRASASSCNAVAYILSIMNRKVGEKFGEIGPIQRTEPAGKWKEKSIVAVESREREPGVEEHGRRQISLNYMLAHERENRNEW